MPVDVLMPALSPTMEKGNLAKWVKNEGDKVKAGDVIAEIETDKATMEVEAVDEGTLGKILVPEGTADVAVNTPIAVILAEGEDMRRAGGDGVLLQAHREDAAGLDGRDGGVEDVLEELGQIGGGRGHRGEVILLPCRIRDSRSLPFSCSG